jgi:5-methylcytosine-specific restriction protein A
MPTLKSPFQKGRVYKANGWTKNNNRKLYDSSYWRNNIRVEVKRRDPFCVECLTIGKYVQTTDIDHIKSISMGGDEYELSNLQGLCKKCHNKKSAIERKAGGEG